MIRLLTAALLVLCELGAVTLEEIDSKPQSRAKNFLIWQYFSQEISPEKADRAFYQIKGVNRKLFLAYAKHSDEEAVKYTAECWKRRASELPKSKDDCLQIAVSPYKAAKLSLAERKRIAKRLEETDEGQWLAMMCDDALEKNLQNYDPETFLKVINGAGTAFRHAHFNTRLSKVYLEKLSGHSGFSLMVKRVVTDKKLDKLHHALTEIDAPRANAQTNFFLALNQLRFNQKNAAMHHLDVAYEKAYYRMDKDKALFWRFQVSRDPKLLERLSGSVDINIYSLYAKELMDREVDNYFTTLQTTDVEPSVDLQDPFVWREVLDTVKSTPKQKLYALSRNYQSPQLLPLQSFIVERASGYRLHNYIMPYEESMKSLTDDQRALMLSLMRQESRFIPSALSSSYALGLMQLMPFLVKALDKKEKEPISSLSDMFDPERNIRYAIKHISWLQKNLYHPLFIAYAYNGGMGFTKRHLLKGTFRKGPYEPFWSMEMMANSESREYGKKVLANYVIYKKALGEEVSIRHLFDTVTEPARTDRFREQG